MLERVFVTRTFTCHQFLGAIETMLPPLADERPLPLALVFHADRLFHDEGIPLWERRHLFDRSAVALGRVRQRGLPILITLCPVRPNPWAGRLERLASSESP